MQDLIKKNISKSLDKGSNILGTDLKYVARGGFWLYIGTITSLALGILSSTIFARFVPQYEYGVYKFILTVFGFFSIFTLSGLGVALTQSIPKGFDRNIFEAFRRQSKWNFYVSLAIIFLSIYYFINKNIVVGLSLLIMALTFNMMTSPLLFNDYLDGKKLFKEKTIYQLIIGIVSTLISVGVVLLTNNVILIVLAHFATFAFLYVYFYRRTIKKHPPQGQENRESLEFGNHMSLINALGTAGSTIDSILIFHFLGAQLLAIYSFAILPINNLLTIKKNLKTLITPRFSERTIKDIKSSVLRKFIHVEIFAIFITLAYIISAPYIFKLLFPTYLDSVFYSQIAVLILLFMPSVLFSQTIQIKERKKDMYIINISTSIIKIILLIFLIPLWGILGAIWAWLISRFYNTIIILFYFLKLKD